MGTLCEGHCVVPGRVVDRIVRHMIVGVIADQVSLCHHPYQDRFEQFQEATDYVLCECTKVL